MDVKTGPNHLKKVHCETRRKFFDWLANSIKIDGIDEVRRDTEFDDEKYRNGGIRLNYRSAVGVLTGLKNGVLLEAGFDEVMPYAPKDISSWAYDHGHDKVNVVDNRAKGVACYDPGYTLVEKLQTVSTKHRQHLKKGLVPQNFMRHYYDIYCLLADPDVPSFLGTAEYLAHKTKRFRSESDPVIAENDAFLLRDPAVRSRYKEAYLATRALYYKNQPSLDDILDRIRAHLERL